MSIRADTNYVKTLTKSKIHAKIQGPIKICQGRESASGREEKMDAHIKQIITKARAGAFIDLLTQKNTHIYEIIILPFLNELDVNDKDAKTALNVVMSCVELLDPFPWVKRAIVLKTNKLAKTSPNDFVSQELNAIIQTQNQTILNWAMKISDHDLISHYVLGQSSEHIQKVKLTLFQIFSCLRQTQN